MPNRTLYFPKRWLFQWLPNFKLILPLVSLETWNCGPLFRGQRPCPMQGWVLFAVTQTPSDKTIYSPWSGTSMSRDQLLHAGCSPVFCAWASHSNPLESPSFWRTIRGTPDFAPIYSWYPQAVIGAEAIDTAGEDCHIAFQWVLWLRSNALTLTNTSPLQNRPKFWPINNPSAMIWMGHSILHLQRCAIVLLPFAVLRV